MRKEFIETRALAEIAVLEIMGRRTCQAEDIIDEVATDALSTDTHATLADVMSIAHRVIRRREETASRRTQGVA